MTDDTTPGRSVHVEIHDVTKGQVIVGDHNTQTLTIQEVLTAEELEGLETAFAELRAQVEREAPADVREEAVRQTEAVRQATVSDKPDVSVMARAKQWFLANAPGLVGAVTGVLINPIVGKVVSSAGSAIANEYQKWFPEAGAPPAAE